jgi:hypothetical protein
LSWEYAVQDDAGRHVSDVELSAWRERGSIRWEGSVHRVFREGGLRGTFVLQGGRVPARAVKPTSFQSTFDIEYGSKHYLLKRRSAFRRDRLLYDEGTVIGRVLPEGSLPAGPS